MLHQGRFTCPHGPVDGTENVVAGFAGEEIVHKLSSTFLQAVEFGWGWTGGEQRFFIVKISLSTVKVMSRGALCRFMRGFFYHNEVLRLRQSMLQADINFRAFKGHAHLAFRLPQPLIKTLREGMYGLLCWARICAFDADGVACPHLTHHVNRIPWMPPTNKHKIKLLLNLLIQYTAQILPMQIHRLHILLLQYQCWPLLYKLLMPRLRQILRLLYRFIVFR